MSSNCGEPGRISKRASTVEASGKVKFLRVPAENGGLYVHYGCGLKAPSNWLNFDASPTLRLQRSPIFGPLARRFISPLFPHNVVYGDIVKGLPIAPGSCIALYCSHVLEHLSLEDFRAALRNSEAVLATGGIFRIVLPDLEQLVSAYARSPEPDACSSFMSKSGLGLVSRDRSVQGVIRQCFGNSRHRWMWDFKGLEKELFQSGFKYVRKASFGDAENRRFSEVEELHRWEGCLGIECSK